MKFRIVIALSALFLLCLILSSCQFSFSSVDELVRAPKLTGQNTLIQDAFEKSVSPEYTLKSPLSGEYRSAYVVVDFDNDEDDEVIVFYVAKRDDGTARMNILDKLDGEWVSVADITGAGSDVNSLNFFDVNGDGANEIIVTWNMLENKNNKYFSVYGYDAGKLENGIRVYATELYTYMYNVDVDSNGRFEVFFTVLNAADEQYTAFGRLMSYDSSQNKMSLISEVKLDPSVTSYQNITSDYADGSVRLYIDGMVSETHMQTEFVIWNKEKKSLYVPTQQEGDKSVTLSSGTLRSHMVLCDDINNDGVIEIPTYQTLLGGVSVDSQSNITENLYLTVWCSLIDSSLIDVLDYIEFPQLNFRFMFPTNYSGKVSVKYNTIEEKVDFYRFDEQLNDNTNLLFSIFRLSSAHDDILENPDKFLIYKNDTFIFYTEIMEEGTEFGFNQNSISELFEYCEGSEQNG